MLNRTNYGQFNGNARLTDSDTRKIVRLLKKKQLTGQKISEMFNVGKSTISDIKCLVTWTHETEKLIKEKK